MELIKLNEAYTLTDKLEKGWEINGLVIKENNGIIHINFSVSDGTLHIGSYNYNNSLDNNVSVNVNGIGSKHDELMEYGNTLVDNILNILNNEEV